MPKRKARRVNRISSRDAGPRLVYSTDPEPEPEQTPPELPRNPAAPFAVQGTQPLRVRLERKGRKGKVVFDHHGRKKSGCGQTRPGEALEG